MLSKKEQTTIDYYNQSALEWNRSRETNRFWKDSFRTFHQFLPSGSIVSLGAGTGRDDQTLSQEYSYNVTSLDLSENMLRIAMQRSHLSRFAQADLYQLPFPSKVFDGVWASAVFLHIPKQNIHTVLRETKRILKPHAIGFISLWEGNDELIDPKTNRFYARYNQSEFSSHLNDVGLSILDVQTQDHPDKKWLKFIIQNNF